MKMKKLLAVPVMALAALSLTAASASAAVRPPRPSVTSTYTCWREPVTLNHRTWNYEEECSLNAVLTGPLNEVRVEITSPRPESVVLYQSAPSVWYDGIHQPQGMGAGHNLITLPHIMFVGSVYPGYRLDYDWVIEFPVNQPRPFMSVQAIR
jgi:hypothetical protein